MKPTPLRNVLFCKPCHGSSAEEQSEDAEGDMRVRLCDFEPRRLKDCTLAEHALQQLLNGFHENNLNTSGIFQFWGEEALAPDGAPADERAAMEEVKELILFSRAAAAGVCRPENNLSPAKKD